MQLTKSNTFSMTRHRSSAMVFIVTAAVALAICTLSLSVFSIFGGYSVTIAAFVVFFYCIHVVNHLSINHILILGTFVVFLTANAFINVLRINEIEFLKSFLLTVIFLFVYITSFESKFNILKYLNYNKALSFSSYVIFGFQIIQITEQLYFGTTSSWFWLDGLSISTADDIGRFEAVNVLGFFRPTSTFHEPSYLAAVAFIILLIVDRLIPSRNFLRYILILCIILSLSSLIVAILFAYLSLNIIFSGKYLTYLSILLIPFLIVTGGNYVLEFFRLNELSQEGTSGYVRFIEPLLLTKSALLDNPFGIPLGQSEVVFNNSLFLFPLYFGVFTPYLVLFWIAIICTKIRITKRIIAYVLGFLSLLLVSGAIFTMESAFLLLLLNSAFMQEDNL